MANKRDDAGPDDVFDIARIRQLVELMIEHDLSEMELRHAPRQIKLRRGPAVPPGLIGYPPIAAAPAPATGSAEPPAAAADSANVVYIRSPMVGTFYAKSKPDAEPYVKVGDVVAPDTIVCQVEAMKMFNEIPAGVSGTIAAILVKNEEPVDVNRPLFKVTPS
jgi:acetyl-CoA carboxylase biotin carboxyl carrier protein